MKLGGDEGDEGSRRGECIPMTRSIPLCGTGATGRVPRTQMNENTAFIDASHIYGSDPRSSRELRAGALIKTSAFHRMVFPPPVLLVACGLCENVSGYYAT